MPRYSHIQSSLPFPIFLVTQLDPYIVACPRSDLFSCRQDNVNTSVFVKATTTLYVYSLLHRNFQFFNISSVQSLRRHLGVRLR